MPSLPGGGLIARTALARHRWQTPLRWTINEHVEFDSRTFLHFGRVASGKVFVERNLSGTHTITFTLSWSGIERHDFSAFFPYAGESQSRRFGPIASQLRPRRLRLESRPGGSSCWLSAMLTFAIRSFSWRKCSSSRTGVCTKRSPSEYLRSIKLRGTDCAPRQSTVGSVFAYCQLLNQPIHRCRPSLAGTSFQVLVA